MNPTMASTAVICDGGVGSLIACAAAGQRWATGPAAPGPKAILLAEHEFQVSAARVHGELFGLAFEPEQNPPPPGHSGDATALVRALLDLATKLRAHGDTDVVWPVSFSSHEGGAPDVQGAAWAMNVAVLVSQLATIAAGPTDASASVIVRAPYADLTERQLADLVLDMDLPIWTCWWMPASELGEGRVRETAIRERTRWTALLRQAGWVGSLEAKAAIVVTKDLLGKKSTPARPGEIP